MLKELIIATGNLHKIQEFRALFKELRGEMDLLSLRQSMGYQPPAEVGHTFEENARLKAQDAAKHFNTWAIADDSGLVVPALRGEPGIYSSRYAGDDATCSENRKKLLMEMSHLEGVDRYAYYECCLVIASPEKVEIVARSLCEGEVILEERGSSGFGYDPIFRKHDYDLTFGQIDDLTKNRISHRRKAFEKLIIAMELHRL